MGLFRKNKIVLALGGGSARGLSNIGVMKVFEKHFGRENMPFDMIVGTSIGSLIGAAYCMGMPLDEVEERALKFSWQSLVDLGLKATGLIKGDRLEKLINDIIDGKNFDDMKIPFALTTTDIETGEELIHSSGNLLKLIRASCSWPGIFNAVEINGRLLVDGGIRNSIPTKAACLSGATFVVAVNPGFSVKNQKVTNMLQAMVQSVQIMGEELNSYQSEAADIAIKPVLKDIDQFDFSKAQIIIKQGEDAAEEKMHDLKRKLYFHRKWF
ncbi:MAG: patatin-like phospholipase family protein [Candidatus Omnitrophota bacterium]